jgi:hypothetical protein
MRKAASNQFKVVTPQAPGGTHVGGWIDHQWTKSTMFIPASPLRSELRGSGIGRDP